MKHKRVVIQARTTSDLMGQVNDPQFDNYRLVSVVNYPTWIQSESDHPMASILPPTKVDSLVAVFELKD